MKRFIYLCFLCALCGSSFGANEIRSFEAGATTCFAVVREIDGDVWYVTGQVFEVWGAGGRTAADYDIALTNKTGGLFIGSFDTNIAAGSYYVMTHMQAGAGPADTDPAVWEDYGYWSGSTWTTNDTTTAPVVADAVWDEPMVGHTGETTFGGELQTLDPNITAILADTNELQTDWTDGGRLDLLIDGIKAVTDIMEAVNSTVSGPNDTNNFIIANTGDINDVNDAYLGMTVYVRDATTNDWESRLIKSWQTGREITVDNDFTFTPDTGDIVIIWGTSYFPISVYNGLPLPPEGETITVDRRVAPAGGTIGGTRTLDAEGEDPP